MARILFIEPDHILGSNAKVIMKRAGHEVDWHVDPQAAINTADSVRPDVIVLDLILAGRSGVEFLYEFRSYPEWHEIPVVVYSNVPSAYFNEAYEGFNQLGIAAYIYKPAATINELVNSVGRILQPVS